MSRRWGSREGDRSHLELKRVERKNSMSYVVAPRIKGGATWFQSCKDVHVEKRRKWVIFLLLQVNEMIENMSFKMFGEFAASVIMGKDFLDAPHVFLCKSTGGKYNQ